jgi:hypothetical protein
VAGRPKLQLPVYAYNGDSSWLGWNLISGRWYHGRAEVDASSVLLAATGRAVGNRITLTVNGKRVTVRIAGEVFDPSGLPTLFTSWQTLGGAAAGLAVGHYDIALKPGTSTQAYSGAMDQALGHGYVVFSPAGPSVAAQGDTTWFRLLALLVAVLAALGVLNSVLMATRERIHDLGVFKAVGLTPRQAIAMVACWAVAPAVIAAVIALPARADPAKCPRAAARRQLIDDDRLRRHSAARQLRARPGYRRPPAAGPGRTGHRRRRRTRARQLGRRGQDRHRLAHRITAQVTMRIPHVPPAGLLAPEAGPAGGRHPTARTLP